MLAEEIGFSEYEAVISRSRENFRDPDQNDYTKAEVDYREILKAMKKAAKRKSCPSWSTAAGDLFDSHGLHALFQGRA